MRYTFLTHTKENNKHYLNLDIDMSTHDFLVESSFIATDVYLGNEQVYFNGTLYTAIMVPDTELLFSANDCVYCVIDMKHKKIIITDIHKAASDSLIVFNNFSNNPTTQFPSQNNILFSKSITIVNDTDRYQDIIMGGCVILENAMAEDGVGSFAMYLDVYFNGKHTYRYTLDCTRKHECLCFDHLFKNVKTNEPVDIYVQYSYGTHVYGGSYQSPTIYNNNVTFYIEGANISYGDSSNIFTYTISDETHSGTSGYGSSLPYATVTGVINSSLTAYRVPDYCTVDGVRYPVKQFYLNTNLPNCKYIAFGNNIEVIMCYGIYTNDMNQSPLYSTDYVSAEQSGYFKNKGVIVIYPDSGIRYIYGSDNYNNTGGFYNDQKSYVINGNPKRLFYFYYDLGGSSLPRGEYPALTFDNVGVYYGSNSSMSFRKTNNLTINAKLIGQLYYSNTYYSYRNTSYPGIAALTQSEGGLSIQEPDNTIVININCEACNTYYLMYYYHCGRAIWSVDDGVEYDDYKGYDTSVFFPNVVRFYEQKIIFNINGTLIYSSSAYANVGNVYTSPETFIKLLTDISENSTTGEITYSTSIPSPTDYNYTVSSYNTWSMVYNYASSLGFNAAVRPWLILNIKGDCYSSLYTSLYYVQIKITIDGNLHCVPMGYYGYLYNNPFADYYMQNDYYYRDGYYYPNDWEVKGTYDISKSYIKTVVRRITERRGWYFDNNGNKLPSYKYFTKVWEPDYAIAPSFNLASLCSYSLNNTCYFKRLKVHRLAGIVYIPTKYTNTSSYSMYPKAKEGGITTRPDYSYFYTNTWTDFSYDEIADDTIILSFGMRDLTSDPIDFSKLSCIGNLYYCNILRIELEDPVVAFLVPPEPSYFYRVYNSYNTGNYIYDTPDGQWDPNWHTYNDQYDAYIEFNAVCLGNIILQYESEKIPDEEVEENMYIKYRLNCSNTSDEDIAEIEEYLDTLTEEQRESDSSHNYRKAECDYYRLKLPKKSNIALGVEDFEFDRTSSFNYASYYSVINNEFVVYPQIKLYDCTKYVGSGFLYNHPYYPERDGDIITLPANLKFFGNRSFRYTMYKKEIVSSSTYYRQVQLNDSYSYYGYKAGETSTSTFDFIEDSVFEGYPISEVRIGKYLEVLPEVFPYADRMTIDPENPNFVISNGYIFSADMKTLYRPVCYTELAAIEPTAQNEYVFQSSVLENIVDFRSFKNDRRITGIEITSDRLIIKPSSSAVLYLPENCDRIILPSGDYTILDSDFDKLSYIEFLNITPTSKYYTIPGSEAGDVYSNFNKTYYYTMNTPNSSSSSWQSFSVTGSRMIFIRTGANVTLPNTCIELGGKVQTGIVTIQQDKITELNVSSPNVKVEGYDIAGANSIFFKDGTDAYYTVDGVVKSDFLWSRMNKNTGSQSSTTIFLYKVPTGPEIDTMTINLDYDKYISPAALKYCNISNLIISARANPNTGDARNINIFKIPITTESYRSSVPYGFFNDYDKTLHYDDENVDNLKQYAITAGSGSYNYKFLFNQTHYTDDQFFFNKLCIPVLNNHLDSLTIDFNPTLLVGRLGWNGITISTGITIKEANNNYSVTFARMYYSGNEWIVNYWALPEIDDFYINYDYTSGNAIFLPFPVDERFKNIHFNPANIAGLTKISVLVVCAAGVKIYPSDLLDQITNHSYKLYYCPDTNLSLSATSYTNHTFGEQSGCPFPSNSTLTLTTCFVHPLFVHPEVCSGIDLVLSADTKFGYSTQIVTTASLVGTTKNMLNQYSDYIRSWNSSAYFNGTTDQLNKYFYLFSPALSRAAYMAKQLAVFSHITSPRLFTYLFRAANISSSDDTYKIFNGSWFELNCATLVSIPYYCFDIDTTDNVDGSGYNLFTYQQFHDMLLDLTSIDTGNKIQIPTNPNGDTDYEFNSNFIDWKAPFVSKQQKRIDSWTITNSTFNGFVDRNVLLHFIDHIIYSGTATAYMIFGKINGSGSSSSFNYDSTNDTYRRSYTYFTGNEDITVTIDPGSLSDPVVIDFGGARLQDIQNASIRNYLKPTSLYHNNFIMDFTANNNYVIRQICMPNCDSDELDFTQYPTCNFVLGDSTNFYAVTEHERCYAKISGFKRVVLGSNVSIYQGNESSIPALPNILFYAAQVEEIEYLGTEVYGITNYNGSNNISTTFGNNITNFDTIFCGAGANSGHIEVDLNRIETIVGWSQYTTYTDQNTVGYAFCYCDFTNSSFDHLISIASNGGINFSVFASQITMPNLTSIGTSGMRENTGIEELSIPLCTSLGEYAFYRNRSLTTLSAPSLVTIGYNAFYDCPISGVLTLESAETIGSNAFNSLDITEVHLPSATNIADNAFYACRNITKAYIPAGCTISITSFFNTTEIVRT